MKITIVNQYFAPDPSPTARLASSLAGYLAEKGHDITVVTSRSSYRKLPNQSEDGSEDRHPRLTVTRMPGPDTAAESLTARIWQYLSFYWRGCRHLSHSPLQDMIIVMTTPPLAAGMAFWNRKGSQKPKVVLWSMDCYPQMLSVAGLLAPDSYTLHGLHWYNDRLLKKLDAAICLDQAMVDRLKERVASLPCHVVPNWEPEDGSRKPQDEIISRHPEIGDRFLILYLGNAGWGHEFETVWDAAQRLHPDQVAFLFVGGGSQTPQMQKAVAEKQLSNCYFEPFVPEAERNRLLNRANLGLITLADSAVGIMSPSKIHAKLANGLPILYVGPKGSNVDEAISEFDCGYSARHGSPESIVAFVEQLIQNRDRECQLRANAAKAYEARYSASAALPHFYRILLDLVDQ